MSDKQRTGTFLCWLFGHKFMFWANERDKPNFTFPSFKDKCIRCGIDKETK